MSPQFDGHASSYHEDIARSISFSGLSHAFFTKAKTDLLLEIAATVGEPQALEALDVGCGIGEADSLLAGQLGSLYGTDVSVASLEEAARRNPSVSYAASDGQRLPYAEGTFDLVFTVCVLHHVPIAERPSFVRELYRVVRPGGVVVVLEHNPWNPLTRLAVSRCSFDEDVVLWGRRKVEKLLRAAGAGTIRHRYILFLPTARTRKLERLISRVPLGAQYACWGYR